MNVTQHPSTFCRSNSTQTWEPLHRQSEVPKVPITHLRPGILHTARAPSHLHTSILSTIAVLQARRRQEWESSEETWILFVVSAVLLFFCPRGEVCSQRRGRKGKDVYKENFENCQQSIQRAYNITFSQCKVLSYTGILFFPHLNSWASLDMCICPQKVQVSSCRYI